MKITKTATLAFLAICAVNLASSAPAFAAIEGPAYEVGGARLTATQTRNIINLKKANGTGNITFSVALLGNVNCTAVAIVSTSPHRIIGSTGKLGGTSKETLTLSGCSVVGNGTPCTVTGGTFTTKPLVNTLGYNEATPKKGTKILVLFKPESGAEIANVEFEGAGCTFKNAKLLGNMIGEAFIGKASQKVEEEQAAPGVEVGEVNFTTPKQTKIWLEEHTILKEVKNELLFENVAAEVSGRIELELENKPNWRVFT
jgi:hypothetical protein